MRNTLSEREGVVTSSKRRVSLSFSWKDVFKSTHCGKRKGQEVNSSRDLGDGSYALDIAPETINAITPEDEPELERAESSAEGEMPISVVDNQTLRVSFRMPGFKKCNASKRTRIALFGPQERRCDIQGLSQQRTIAYPKCRTVKIDKTPLMSGFEEYSKGIKRGGRHTLWKFVQKEVAISLISVWYSLSRYSGQESATPAQAASTWIQREG